MQFIEYFITTQMQKGVHLYLKAKQNLNNKIAVGQRREMCESLVKFLKAKGWKVCKVCEESLQISIQWLIHVHELST